MRQLWLLTIVFTLLAGIGCRTAACGRSVDTAERIGALKEEIVRMQGQVRSTQAALEAFTGDPNAPDLAARFDRFSEEFDRTVASAQRARELAGEMRAEGHDLLADWARRTGQTRDLAERDEVLEAKFVLARSALRPYMQALYDTIGFLRPELSAERILDIQEMARESGDAAQTIIARYEEIVQELDLLSATLAESSAAE